MGKALWKGALFGGIVAYVWMMISWVALPWHCGVLKTFHDEEAVAIVIRDNTEENGTYLLPNVYCYPKDLEGDTKKTLVDKSKLAMERGPFMYASVRKFGFESASPGRFVISLIIQIIGAFIITLLVWQARHLSYYSKVGFVTLIGFSIGWLAGMPDWNWLGFSFSYIVMSIADYVIAWFLAGLVIAGVSHQ